MIQVFERDFDILRFIFIVLPNLLTDCHMVDRLWAASFYSTE